MLSFKDFIVVDYTPGMPDQISYNAMKSGRIGESSQIKSQSKKVKEAISGPK